MCVCVCDVAYFGLKNQLHTFDSKDVVTVLYIFLYNYLYLEQRERESVCV